MYQAHQQDRYDHTTAILSAWSKRPVKNPYRKANQFRPMRNAELYALAKALEKRNARRHG